MSLATAFQRSTAVADLAPCTKRWALPGGAPSGRWFACEDVYFRQGGLTSPLASSPCSEGAKAPETTRSTMIRCVPVLGIWPPPTMGVALLRT
jgi:hypothetical protein